MMRSSLQKILERLTCLNQAVKIGVLCNILDPREHIRGLQKLGNRG